MNKSIDTLVEVICLALGDEYFQETFINNITIHPPTDDSQLLTVKNISGEEFTIQINKL
jgi:hypothetical protein